MIRFSRVYKAFGHKRVLEDVSMSVAPGTVHFVIGRSGAGKSVLIKQIVGLLSPDSGSIKLDGQELTDLDEDSFFPVRRRCQMIFQHATLFDALTVLENITMPLRKRFQLSRPAARQKAQDALDSVGAVELAERYPSQLGAGVRKRVAIARAIALSPEVLLYDEPTTSLDPVAARRTDRLIRRMTDQHRLTSVVVSHDLVSVRDVGDRVTMLDGRTVAFDGTPEELFVSNDPVVHDFVHGISSRWDATAR